MWRDSGREGRQCRGRRDYRAVERERTVVFTLLFLLFRLDCEVVFVVGDLKCGIDAGGKERKAIRRRQKPMEVKATRNPSTHLDFDVLLVDARQVGPHNVALGGLRNVDLETPTGEQTVAEAVHRPSLLPGLLNLTTLTTLTLLVLLAFNHSVALGAGGEHLIETAVEVCVESIDGERGQNGPARS